MGPVGNQRANGKQPCAPGLVRGAWLRLVAAIGVAACNIGTSRAQQVQIPQAAPGVYGSQPPATFSGPTTWPAAPGVAAPVTPPAPAFDPYASGAGQFAAPPAAVPYNAAPYTPVAPAPVTPYPGAPALGAPAPVAPYPGATLGGTPYSPQPYSGVPPAPSVYGSSPALDPNPAPGNWPLQAQSGSWGYQQPDGTVVTFQKLIQELSAEFTFVAGESKPDEFGVDTLELTTTFAVPVFANIDTPLLITPGFAFNWFTGPDTEPDPDDPLSPTMPPRAYDAYLDFAWYPQFSEMFGADLGFRTGVWTDFEHVTSDSMRFLGRGVGRVRLNPEVELLAGAVYLDRVDIKILPVGGVHWVPNPDWDLYLVFPNPKARRRFTTIGNSEWWWYVSGEYGGDSWTLDRDGTNDRTDYNDIRVILGLEWETQTLIHGFFEAGYVWDREIVFADSGAPTFKPNETYMLRTGVDF